MSYEDMAAQIRKTTEELIAKGPEACRQFLIDAGIVKVYPPQSEYEKAVADYLGYGHFTEIETDLQDAVKWAEKYKTKEIFQAARETVLLHHYNGSEREPAYFDKYVTFEDYLNNTPPTT